MYLPSNLKSLGSMQCNPSICLRPRCLSRIYGSSNLNDSQSILVEFQLCFAEALNAPRNRVCSDQRSLSQLRILPWIAVLPIHDISRIVACAIASRGSALQRQDAYGRDASHSSFAPLTTFVASSESACPSIVRSAQSPGLFYPQRGMPRPAGRTQRYCEFSSEYKYWMTRCG